MEWNEPALYEVARGRDSMTLDVYWITREWSDMDRRHYLWGAYIWDGKRTAPREIINPGQIVRKIGGAA